MDNQEAGRPIVRAESPRHPRLADSWLMERELLTILATEATPRKRRRLAEACGCGLPDILRATEETAYNLKAGQLERALDCYKSDGINGLMRHLLRPELLGGRAKPFEAPKGYWPASQILDELPHLTGLGIMEGDLEDMASSGCFDSIRHGAETYYNLQSVRDYLDFIQSPE